MTEKSENIIWSKRQALQKMLGIGAGLSAATELFAQTAPHPHRHPPTPPPKTSIALAPPPLSAAGAFHAAAISGVYDVRTFGAKGDGKALDTPAINKAIETAAAAGGGTVLVPAGTYLCYSIHLKSNIALYLDHGATILGAEPPAEGGSGGYDPPEPGPEPQYQDFGHSHWHNSLIWGEGLQNVSIIGPGLIWGKGLRRSVGHRGYLGLGDKAIALKRCHNVTLRDFSIFQGGHFGILATGVDNFTMDNLVIDTNRDGMDIDCCQNVRVSNCTVNSPWDDGICPKSSYALGEARPTKNLTITNCFVTGGYELGTVLDGTFKRWPDGYRVGRTGRIKCGTESNGGFQNITISNCVFERCQGLALETVDGALLEDISVSNVTMRDIVNMPIFLRLGSRMRGPEGTPVGKLRRVNISNVVVSNTSGRYASILSGIPGHAIEDVKLSNIYVVSQGGGTQADAAITLPEKQKGYPEPTMFGTTPCYGFYMRHVRGIDMSHVEVQYAKDDARPAFVLDDVEGADFLRIKAQHENSVPVFALNNVEKFAVDLSRPLADTYLEQVEQKKI
ncbi:MAG TPA: glycoside hydrolase family 28 protein [Terriglobia bacterium]|nr:glycoside hydrolase family 28 protein [Terriglobia bacterium]